MALIGSLGTGTAALRAFQRGLEVVGNDIANSNTTGFKEQRVEYKDNFYNVLNRSLTQAQGGGASNTTANMVGTGVNARLVSTNFSQGQLETTGIDSDMAIEGNGFFKVEDLDQERTLYTRAGNFRIDSEGYLITQEGYRVQGLTGGTAQFTASGSTAGNGTRAVAAVPTITGQALDVTTVGMTDNGSRYDSGNAPKVTIVGDGVGATAEAVVGADGKISGINITNGGQRYTYATLVIEEPPKSDLSYVKTTETAPTTIGDIQILAPDFATGGLLTDATQPFATGSITAAEISAQAPVMDTYSIDNNGNIDIILSNGDRFTIGQVLLQQFTDLQALNRNEAGYFDAGELGETNFANAFTAQAASPNALGLGKIHQGHLELSNTDQVRAFSDLITTQRSFQGAARIITTSDEILQVAVNLKR